MDLTFVFIFEGNLGMNSVTFTFDDTYSNSSFAYLLIEKGPFVTFGTAFSVVVAVNLKLE